METISKPKLKDLPVGAKFFVMNGAWNGEIILLNGIKHVLVVETQEQHPLLEDGYNDDLDIVTEEYERKTLNRDMGPLLRNSDKDCEHDIESLWDGLKCKKCSGWYCE